MSLLAAAVFLSPLALEAAGRGQLEINVIDRDTQAPVAVRMKLRDQRGKPVKPPKVPWLNDHFVFEGKIVLDLPAGAYTFDMERGPEYRTRGGSFQLERDATDNKTVDMPRFFDMKKEGWWSGDLHVQRDPKQIDLLMRAEDLHLAPVVTWSNEPLTGIKPPPAAEGLLKLESQRFVNLLTGRDRRDAGELLFFHLPQPLPIAGVKGEIPPAGELFAQALSEANAHIDVARPYSWDLPVWVATGKVQSFEVFGDHILREGTQPDPPGKPRDTVRFGGSQGMGRWSLDVYYQLLNCGLRIPPTAGSGSGLNSNPVGYHRVYVHCDEFTYDNWWQNLRAGRTVVTNGPLLQPRVNGELPGHIFQADAGQAIDLNVSLNLGTREKIEYLEVVKDGKPIQEVRLDEWAKNRGELPPVRFEESGWLLVRVVTNNPDTFRGAITAPYYVEIGYEKKISKRAAQFFLDWVVDRVKKLKIEDAAERERVLAFHRAARDFWQKMVADANAD